jgi:hypothetical protein
MAPPTQAFSYGAPVLAQPAVPASAVAQQNVNAYPVQVVISLTTGTVSAVFVNGVQVGSAAGTYTVPAYGSISVTWATAAPAWVWSGAGVSGDLATWNTGTSTLTNTVAAGGAFVASFAGQCYANLNTPLPGWLSGQPA